MDVPEIGACEVTLNAAGASAPLFQDFPLVPLGAPMHGVAVERVPDGGVVLARNAHCAIQSFSFADIAYGVQYHMEANRVPEWKPTECPIQERNQIPEYRKPLEQVAGANGPQRLEQQTIGRIKDFRHFSQPYTEIS
jgi:GMP synthase-like glutamine amidotransferase